LQFGVLWVRYALRCSERRLDSEAIVISHQLLLICVISCGVGIVMILQGLSKSALERSTSRCPNCGRQIPAHRACDCLLR